MKKRCSPWHRLVLPGLLGIFLLLSHLPAFSQCQGEFKYKATSTEPSSAGAIEISVSDPEPGSYTFKVYNISGEITLVQTRQVASPEKIIIEGLAPGTYLVKVEWGTACSAVVGGLEGISITTKSPQR